MSVFYLFFVYQNWVAYPLTPPLVNRYSPLECALDFDSSMAFKSKKVRL
jgi:hypothetical protein